MKILLAPIPSIMSLVPEVEEPDTWRLLCALAGLETFIRAFKNAVDLFDFSILQIQQVRDNRKTADPSSDDYWIGEKIGRFGGWGHIAARDGALQIYHLGMVMGKIRGQLHNTPTLRPFVDKESLKTAVKLFKRYFPNYVLIREAVTHSHYERAPNAVAFRQQARDQRLFVTDTLIDNNYTITKDKMITSYEICEATYAKLKSVHMRFLSGFDDARAEVVKQKRKSANTEIAGSFQGEG